MKNYETFLNKILIDGETLQNRISELGAEISQDYTGKDPHLICILRGGVMFLTDLMRQITIPHTIDFMAISSYGAGKRESSGQVRLSMDLKDDIHGRHVLLVEDIIDSGNTLSSVLELLMIRKPASLKICTLLDKIDRREVDVEIDYCGFVIPDRFVFGYGLDLDEYYRNLPFIGIVDLEKFQPPED
jgi:hypoxanthine phosphoribosyltransferase